MMSSAMGLSSSSSQVRKKNVGTSVLIVSAIQFESTIFLSHHHHGLFAHTVLPGSASHCPYLQLCAHAGVAYPAFPGQSVVGNDGLGNTTERRDCVLAGSPADFSRAGCIT